MFRYKQAITLLFANIDFIMNQSGLKIIFIAFSGIMNKAVFFLFMMVLLPVFFACRKDDDPEPEADRVWVAFEHFSDMHPITGEQVVFDIPVVLSGEPDVFPGYINFHTPDKLEINDTVYTATAINNYHYQIRQENIPFPDGSLASYIRVELHFAQMIERRLYTIIFSFQDGPFNIAEDPQQKHFIFSFYKHIPFEMSAFEGSRTGSMSSYWGGPYADIEIGFTHLNGDTMLIDHAFTHLATRWGESWTEGPHQVKAVFSTSIPYLPSVQIPYHQRIGTTDGQKQYWIKGADEAPFSPQTKKVTLDAYITSQDADNLIDHIRWESTD